jgi:hypothetical protein
MTIQAQTGPGARVPQRVATRPLPAFDAAVAPFLSVPMSPHRVGVLAQACLLIDDARLYGLIDSGPDVNRARCEEIIDDLARQGIGAAQEEIEAAALSLMAEFGAVRP